MKLPVIQGIIDRRILINYTADPEYIQRLLPPIFTPVLVKDRAVVGICLIRLKQIRPKGWPAFTGVSSENGAHRIAVQWEENGERKEGVYVPRRDTSLRLNSLVGGRIFPGKHHLARFDVKETDKEYSISFRSEDKTHLSIKAALTNTFPGNSVFNTLEEASTFFRKGETGYSPNGKSLDGLTLKTHSWQVSPLDVSHVSSSFFEDEQALPKGSVHFDNALLMTGIKHEWHNAGKK